ncbi:MAG TPA: hypothetical protein VME43_08705 [Bryobacteraceae bacterium]|nr:hypothetical protein [Bryobacteraceae bacterium]
MKRLIIIALAAMPAIPAAPAQQAGGGYQFRPLVVTGAMIGGHTLDRGAVIDGVALNDSGDFAFVARWSEDGMERTAVFTSKRFVAGDGDVIDGKRIDRILGTSLSLNTGGTVAYEAVYGGTPRITAIFVERKHKADLSQSGSPYDFALQDNGEIVLKAAAQAPAAPRQPTTLQTAQNTGALAIFRSLEGRLHSPIPLPDPSVGMSNPRPKSKTSAGKAAVPTARPCPAPAFPYPGSWNFGDEMTGPISSHLYEEAPKTKPYESRYLGRLSATSRITQFNQECKPLLITIADTSQPDRFEIRTPNGLLTNTRADGFLDLNGYAGKALPDRLARVETPMRVNRSGAVLIPVRIAPERFAILLGTPPSGLR